MQNNQSDKKTGVDDNHISADKIIDAVDAKQQDGKAGAVLDKASQEAKEAEKFDHGKHDAGAKK